MSETEKKSQPDQRPKEEKKEAHRRHQGKKNKRELPKKDAIRLK